MVAVVDALLDLVEEYATDDGEGLRHQALLRALWAPQDDGTCYGADLLAALGLFVQVVRRSPTRPRAGHGEPS